MFNLKSRNERGLLKIETFSLSSQFQELGSYKIIWNNYLIWDSRSNTIHLNIIRNWVFRNGTTFSYHYTLDWNTSLIYTQRQELGFQDMEQDSNIWLSNWTLPLQSNVRNWDPRIWNNILTSLLRLNTFEYSNRFQRCEINYVTAFITSQHISLLSPEIYILPVHPQSTTTPLWYMLFQFRCCVPVYCSRCTVEVRVIRSHFLSLMNEWCCYYV